MYMDLDVLWSVPFYLSDLENVWVQDSVVLVNLLCVPESSQVLFYINAILTVQELTLSIND